jgi:hypothetical protein
MKKITILILMVALLALASCQATPQEIEYTDDAPIQLEMKNETLKILQVTDLHLTFGNLTYNDRMTLETIDLLVQSDDFDLIVITGDMTMSTSGARMFSALVRHMEALQTPWTFVFGNHETDYHEYVDFLDRIEGTEYLQFKVGPEMDNGGVGNFRIQFTKDAVPFYNLYFFDSHCERDVYTEEEGEYDYIQTSQVEWYEGHVASDTVDSVAFMHMPLRQFIDPIEYVGVFEEDKVYAQGVDTGLFDAMVDAGLTKGVFVGHDHLNDFYLILNGIYLAYGRITGYNAYGNLERGGRVIAVDASGLMTTSILLRSEAE